MNDLKKEIKELNDKLREIELMTKPHYARLAKLKETQKDLCKKTITKELRSSLSTPDIKAGIHREKIILPCDNMKIKSSYSSGSYYDKSCTTYYVSCDLCGYYEEFYEY